MVGDIFLAVAPLVMPIIAAVIVVIFAALDASRTARNWILSIVMGIAFVLNTYLLFQVFAGVFVPVEMGALVVNESGVFMAELVLFISFIAVVYSVKYMSAEKDDTLYYVLICIFTGTMVGLIYSFNLIILYMFLEASTVTSAILVTYGRTKRANRAAIIYLAISILGGLFILAAEFVLFAATGIESIIDPAVITLSADIRVIISVLMIIGFGVKAGIIPFGYIWLPKAHAEAPSPISALLSGVLVQVAAFAMIRTVGVLGFDVPAVPLILIVFGIASMVTGAITAILEVFGKNVGGYQFKRDIKRVLAYSTISEVGFIIMFGGIQGLFGPFAAGTEYAALSAMLIHIVNHGLSKALLFFSVGIIMYYLHVRDIGQMGGLKKSMPVTTTTFIIGGLSLAMIPPLLGYRSMFEIAFVIFPYEINIYLIASIVTVVITLALYLSAFAYMFIKSRPSSALGDISVDSAKATPPPRVKWYQPGHMIIPNIIIMVLIIVVGLLFISGILTNTLLNLEEIAKSIIVPGV
ncbi:MAG: complex I subunit 5 family protein [Candidatus Odinarchaeia archaeon]